MSIGLLLTCKFQVVGYAIIIMIIRKIIMNYDEPAKTSVGEVARYGYGRTERPCEARRRRRPVWRSPWREAWQ